MHRIVATTLAVVFIALSPALARTPITIEAPHPVLYPGDVFHLVGKEHFNAGQLRNLAVHIDGVAVEGFRINEDRFGLIVPEDAAPGPHSVTLVKHDGIPGRDIILFTGAIEVAADVVEIEEASAVAGPDGAVVTIDGAIVTLPPGAAGEGTLLELRAVRSAAERRRFQDEIGSSPDFEGVPAAGAGAVTWEISLSADASQLALQVQVPDDLAAAAGAGFVPELWAEVDECGDEAQRVFHRLNAELVDGVLTAHVPGFLITSDCAETIEAEGDLHIAAAAVAPKKVKINAALGSGETACGLVSAAVSAPASTHLPVQPSSVVALAATLDFFLPERFTNPTRYAPPVVNRGFTSKHTAIDLKSLDGDPIYAVANGKISTITTQPHTKRTPPLQCKNGSSLTTSSAGYYIMLQHDDSNKTSYSHLVTDSQPKNVTAGATVVAGQLLADADNTGSSCGSHLHLVYRLCGQRSDPGPWLAGSFPQPDDYVKQLTIVAVVDGIEQHATRATVTAAKQFAWNASLDLAPLKLTPGKHTLQIKLSDPNGLGPKLWSGVLEIPAPPAKSSDDLEWMGPAPSQITRCYNVGSRVFYQGGQPATGVANIGNGTTVYGTAAGVEQCQYTLAFWFPALVKNVGFQLINGPYPTSYYVGTSNNPYSNQFQHLQEIAMQPYQVIDVEFPFTGIQRVAIMPSRVQYPWAVYYFIDNVTWEP